MLVIDHPKTEQEDNYFYESFKVISLDILKESYDLGKKILDKYSKSFKKDNLRWSLKPVFIKHLIDQGYNEVIFTDPDTYYFSDFSFLFDELKDHSVILTPHWRSSNPEMDQGNFDLLFVGGLFNGGFIGINQNGIDAMDWWARMCLHRCEIDFTKGQYVDQTYLNLFPVLFDGVKILKHKGCNVANWNQVDCPRVLVGNEVMIDGKWPIVFIHFTKSTIRGIINGSDHMLKPYLDRYLSALSAEGVDLDQDKFKSAEHITQNKPTIFSMIRNKIRGTVHEFFR